jgi:hypothetical protein
MTETLVKWSEKLEHFYFFKSKGSLLPALKHHSSTLRTIELCSGTDADFDAPIFDASFFPVLTHVRLSLCKDIDVLGPSVTHFTWDLSTHPSCSNTGEVRAEDREPWFYFGAQQEACLRSTAIAAVAQNAVLRTIHIEFNPYDDGRDGPNPWNNYNTLSAWYPWELMERIRDGVLRPSGRELTYSKPQRDFAATVKQRENHMRRSITEAQVLERQIAMARHR